jgi:hypothetical protein
MPTALDNGSHRLRIALGDFLRKLLRRESEPGRTLRERAGLRNDAARRLTERPADDEFREVHGEE